MPLLSCEMIFFTLLLLCCTIERFASTADTTAPTTIAFNIAASSDERSDSVAIPQCEESTANVFWPVFVTLVVVLAAALVAYFVWKYYWRIRHGKHLVLVTDVEKADPEYAFDNPGFREGTPVVRAKKQPTDTKENASLDDSNGFPKTTDEFRTQSLDHSLVPHATSSSIIPLKGRDFAGLGFGISGTKRDGIFVKDLLHHGPASESGRIKPGDRITAVRINFGDIEFKDAEDILRSASPYEIEIEVEDIRSGAKRSFFRDHSFSIITRSQVAPVAYANGTAPKNDAVSASSKPAVLEVLSEVSDKMCRYGVKVLPDIGRKPNLNTITINQPVTIEKQTASAAAGPPTTNVSSTVVVVDQLSFDEVDLPLPQTSSPVEEVPSSRPAADKANLVTSFKDANVKKALVQGYQNLKDKIAQRVHKSTVSTSLKEDENGQQAVGAVAAADDVDSSRIEFIDLRLRSGSVSSTEDLSAPKAAKRKAPPRPPPETSPAASSNSDERRSVSCVAVADGSSGGEFNLLSEIDKEVKKNSAEGDSDSEMEEADRLLNTTIELNASHITVHHGADDTNRKAASMGDLSKIEGDAPRAPPPLERAVSLELTEHTPRASKKRKAPHPPEECIGAIANDAVGAEDAVDVIGGAGIVEPGLSLSKLKKSSLFGTLEPPLFAVDADVAANLAPSAPKLKKSSQFGTMAEALKPAEGFDSDEYAGSSHYTMVVSTPLKATRIQMDGWQLAAQNGDRAAYVDDDDDDDENEVIPALPTSPVPTLPPTTTSNNTFVTEIDVKVAPNAASTSSVVTTGDVILTPSLSTSDVEDAPNDTLFTTAAELNFSRVCADESSAGSVSSVCISNATGVVSGSGRGSSSSVSAEEVDDSRDECSSMDTVKEMSRDECTESSVTPAAPTPPVVDKPNADVVADVAKVGANVAVVATKSDATPNVTTETAAPTVLSKFDASAAAVVSQCEATDERTFPKVNTSRSSSSCSSSTSSVSSTASTRSVNSVSSSVNGGGASTRASPRRFSSGGFVVDAKIKSPNATVKSPKVSQSVSPVRAVGSRIPVRANTEPSLKVSLIHKDDSPTKIKRQDGAAAIENGKASFVSSNHMANAPHKTVVLTDVRHNGPNR